MSDEGLTIQYSPGTFARVQQDPNLLAELVSQVQSGQAPADQETALTSAEVLNSIIEGEREEQCADVSIWVDVAVKLLLSTVGDLRPKVGKSLKLKNKAKMWKEIQKKMSAEGYSFTAMQIENKYRGLERTYKKAKCHNSKTGRNMESCRYERELSELLNDRPSVFPNCLVGTSRKEVLSHDSQVIPETLEPIDPDNDYSEPQANMCLFCLYLLLLLTADLTNKENNISQAGSLNSSKKKTQHEEIIEELRLIRQERKDQTCNILKALDEASRRTEAIMEERNSILRDVLNSLTK